MGLKSAYEHLDLFSGIGGFALAARWNGLRTIQFVEYEPYAQKVLKKNFPDVPIHDDIKDFNATKFRQPFLCTGGYPCQPFSNAGLRRGEKDDRHLWPEMLRVIQECRPTWVLAENVAGHITMGLDQVLSDLEGEDYACQPFVIPACAKDASHRRDRVWIVAHANEQRLERSTRPSIQRRGNGFTRNCEDVAHAKEQRLENVWRCQQLERKQNRRRVSKESSGTARNNNWLPEPDVGRVAHGVSNRVDRLRGVGNAIVPQVASEIIRAMVRSS